MVRPSKVADVPRPPKVADVICATVQAGANVLVDINKIVAQHS